MRGDHSGIGSWRGGAAASTAVGATAAALSPCQASARTTGLRGVSSAADWLAVLCCCSVQQPLLAQQGCHIPVQAEEEV